MPLISTNNLLEGLPCYTVSEITPGNALSASARGSQDSGLRWLKKANSRVCSTTSSDSAWCASALWSRPTSQLRHWTLSGPRPLRKAEFILTMEYGHLWHRFYSDSAFLFWPLGQLGSNLLPFSGKLRVLELCATYAHSPLALLFFLPKFQNLCIIFFYILSTGRFLKSYRFN